MSLSRRDLLALSALATLGLPKMASAALSELKILAPAAPGGGWDQTARTMQSVLLAEKLVGSAPVNNVPGAGGTIGLAQYVNGAKGDGNSIMVSGFVMVGAILLNKSAVTLDQVTPIARLTSEWEAIVVPANSPLKDAKDLVAAIKADVAKVSWGGGSAGGVDHIAAALFAGAVGADASKVNYVAHSGGGESLASILGGKVTVGVAGVSEFEQHVKAGRLRWLGITAPKGTKNLPGPTFQDQGIDFEIQNWRGLFGGPGLSDAQVKELVDTITAMAKSKGWADQLVAKGWDDNFLAGKEFADFVKDEQKRVDGVLRAVGLVK